MQRTPCDFCGYLSGKHDWACPKSDSMSEDAKVQARKDWDKGYHAGWTSGVNPADASRSYKLGYGHGATELRGMQDDGELFSDLNTDPEWVNDPNHDPDPKDVDHLFSDDLN